jgi:hypothetical protein
MAMTFEIRVQMAGPFMDPGVTSRFDREISAGLLELAALGQRLIVQGTPRGISAGGGGLAGSIFTELRGTPARREAVVASSAFYAPIVEVGRQPGRWPSLAPIMLWVRRKLHVSDQDAPSVAYLVARKIGEQGTPGAHMFEWGVERLRPIAQQRFQQLSQRLAQGLGGGA